MKTLSELETFLEKSEKLLGSPSEADLKAVKDTLEALRKISPDLIDAKIFERLSRLVNSVEIAKDTQRQVADLALKIKTLEIKIGALTSTLQMVKAGFDSLERRLMLDAESERVRREKLGVVLEELEQYLRRHM